MHKRTSVNRKWVHVSKASSDSETSLKRDTITMNDTTPRSQIHSQWIKYKLRECTISEAVVFLVLVFLLITCYRITTQNQEILQTVSNIQSQLNSFQERTNGECFMKQGTEKRNENESEKTKTMREEDVNQARKKSDEQLEAGQANDTSNSEKTHIPPKNPNVSTNTAFKLFNAASLIAQSSVDKSLSSSSNLNPFFGFDQSSLVLVDRPEPPPNKAWCTSDKNPVLTVKLGYYIYPKAVSYQHSKWNGMVPDDAPKLYSVVACLDNHCITRKPLFSHCEYNQHGMQEQICNNISYDSISSPVAKLQFQFHKNHGNTEKTCVSLVRVYSKTKVVKEQKIRRLRDTTTCIDLKHHYHHNPMIYKYFTNKNCALLYSKECCQDCPECCEECDINDTGPEETFIFLLFVGTIIFSVIATSFTVHYSHFEKPLARA